MCTRFKNMYKYMQEIKEQSCYNSIIDHFANTIAQAQTVE